MATGTPWSSLRASTSTSGLQILQLAQADLIKTYRGSALGWMWAIIKPSVTIFVYWFAFSFGLRAASSVNGFPFFLWLIAGIVPWFYMSEMLTQGSQTLKRYNYLVTKIKFPVSTISTFVSLSKLYVHFALLAVVVMIFVLVGLPGRCLLPPAPALRGAALRLLHDVVAVLIARSRR